MIDKQLSGAAAALLDEYRKAIDELISVITPLNEFQLCAKLNPGSDNPDTLSIQSILTHVCASVYSYAVYIENHIALNTTRPEKGSFNSVEPYIHLLNEGYAYTKNLFVEHPEISMEEHDPSKKIAARWGQQYDVEQMMEHAIVHVLRHRRQIALLILSANWQDLPKNL